MPWTEALGAILGAAVMTNVVALNFCYDVAVKQYSLHLLAMCVFLGWSGITRVLRLLVFKRAQLATDTPVFAQHSWQKCFLAAQVVLGIVFAATNLNNVHQQTVRDQTALATLPYGGFWTVDEFKVDGDVSNKVVSAVPQWKAFVMDSPFTVLIQGEGGFRLVSRWTIDPDKKTLILGQTDTGSEAILGVENPTQDQLILRGPWHGHLIEARLHRAEMPKFTLLTRHFHWISEYPYNR
jgi:hypothetical protein